MKQLLIVRHAKTEQFGYDNDIDRQLIPRGYSDIELMAERLSKTGFIPDFTLVSKAKRTRQTFKHLAKTCGWKHLELNAMAELYNASAQTLFMAITKAPFSVNRLVLVAHNPGVTSLFNIMGNNRIDHLPTCGMALFEFEISDWEDLEPETGILKWCSWPKKTED